MEVIALHDKNNEIRVVFKERNPNSELIYHKISQDPKSNDDLVLTISALGN